MLNNSRKIYDLIYDSVSNCDVNTIKVIIHSRGFSRSTSSDLVLDVSFIHSDRVQFSHSSPDNSGWKSNKFPKVRSSVRHSF